jgi:hypothetical protein
MPATSGARIVAATWPGVECGVDLALPLVLFLQWDKDGFLHEVAAEHHLRHVDPSQIHDASKPVIPADAHVGETPLKAVLQQIGSGELPPLKHVEPPQ